MPVFSIRKDDTMKILHTADWHLGIDVYKVSMEKDQRYFLSQLRMIVLEEEIDVVLISGDVYDTALASKEAITLFNDAMHMLCMELKKQVIVIAGNHDSATRLASCASILAPMGLHIIGKIEEKIRPIQIQDAYFYPFPYFHIETMNRVYQTQVKSEYEAFVHMIQELKEELSKPGCHIGLAHTFLVGMATCDSERYIEVGGSEAMDASVFHDFDYVAMGHLHRMQKATKKVVYSGSPLPYSFSEAKQKKYVMIFDTHTKDITRRQIHPLHPFQIYKGTFAQIKEGLLLEPCLKDTYVKVEIEDQMVSHELVLSLQEYIPHLLQVSGKGFESDSKITLEANQLDTLDDDAIIEHFFMDMFQENLDEEQRNFYYEAKQAIEEDGDAA